MIRRGENEGFAFMHEPQRLCFLTAAADKAPKITKERGKGRPKGKGNKNRRGGGDDEEDQDGDDEEGAPASILMSEECADSAKRKIRVMFEVARDQGINALVLGAFGCGSYR